MGRFGIKKEIFTDELEKHSEQCQKQSEHRLKGNSFMFCSLLCIKQTRSSMHIPLNTQVGPTCYSYSSP